VTFQPEKYFWKLSSECKTGNLHGREAPEIARNGFAIPARFEKVEGV